MHDLEIGESWFRVGIISSLADKLKTEELRVVARNLVKNMDRVYELTLLLPHFLGLAKMRVYSETVAMNEVAGTYPYFFQQTKEEDRAKIHAMRKKIVFDLAQKQHGKGMPNFIAQGAELAHNILNEFEMTHLGTHVLFESAIIATWTAFEVMAQELWEAALNAHPGTLCHLNGSRKDYKPNETMPKPKPVKVELIAKAGFDLSKKMGTVLKEDQDFSKLKTIRHAFTLAFSQDFKAIDRALQSRSLDLLSAVRNAIIHHGGVVKSEWWEEKRAAFLTEPYFGQLKEEDQIELNGKRTSKLISQTLCVSARLIKRVDSWIMEN